MKRFALWLLMASFTLSQSEPSSAAEKGIFASSSKHKKVQKSEEEKRLFDTRYPVGKSPTQSKQESLGKDVEKALVVLEGRSIQVKGPDKSALWWPRDARQPNVAGIDSCSNAKLIAATDAGIAAHKAGDSEKEEAAFKEALEYAKEHDISSDLYIARINLFGLYLNKRDYKAANAYVDDLLTYESRDPVLVADRTFVAKVLLENGRIGKSYEILSKVVNDYENWHVKPVPSGPPAQRDIFWICQTLSNLFDQAGDKKTKSHYLQLEDRLRKRGMPL